MSGIYHRENNFIMKKTENVGDRVQSREFRVQSSVVLVNISRACICCKSYTYIYFYTLYKYYIIYIIFHT